MSHTNDKENVRMWNQPTIERREKTCYDCDLFLANACDGFDEDIKECVDYSDCWIEAKG